MHFECTNNLKKRKNKNLNFKTKQLNVILIFEI